MLPVFFGLFLLTSFSSPYVCTDDVLKQNYHNQNMCQLLGEIPEELKNLPYAVYPNDARYDTVRFIYNKSFNLFPHAIITPRNSKEMAFVLKSLRAHKLPFSLRSGGHCYEPGSLSSGYVIDLAGFRTIKPNLAKGEVVVGAGCLLGDLIETVGALDYAVPTGDCPVVGATGLSLGGGQGVLTRLYGLTADAILSLSMMTADGELIEVNETSHPDLFWAMRGAGNGSYGVVLGLTFKMYPIAKTHYVELSWDLDPTKAAAIFDKWQSWLNGLPHEITTHIRLQYGHGQSLIKLSAVKIGPEPLNEWKELFESFEPKVKTFSGRYVDSAKYWAESHSNPFSKSKSAMIMEPMKQEGIAVIVDLLARMEKEKSPYRVHFTIASMGGESAKGDTAFFPRQSLAMWHQMVTWKVPEDEKAARQTLETFHQEIAPYVSSNCYANIVDYDLGDDYLRAYYGDHVERLIEIKKKYDPTDFFHWKQSIPLK